MIFTDGRRVRKHRRHRSRNRAFLAVCVLAGIAVAALVIVALVGVPIPIPSETQPAALSSEPDAVRSSDFAPALPPREVYKYSVIDGGAYNVAELSDAINRDPIVSAHYRAIDTANVRAEILNAERLAYMSYRRGDQIYWTKHKVRLRQGETILTDGVTQVRSRCGNCISLEPMQPTAEDEPEMVEFEALMSDPTALPTLPSSPRVFTIPPGLLLPPPFGTAPIDLIDPIDPIGPLAIGLIAENVGDSTTNLDNPSEPGGARPIDLFPVPPGDSPFPEDGSGTPGPPFGSQPPSGPKEPPLVELPPPFFDPPIDVPEDFVPEEPLNPPDDVVPVPEPGTLLLIGSGAIGLLARRRRSS